QMDTKLLEGCYVNSVNYFETGRGIAFSAKLFLDGKEIGTIYNDGTGGCTYERITMNEMRQELIERSKNHMKAYDPQIVHDSLVVESFLNHLMDMHDFGRIISDEELLSGSF